MTKPRILTTHVGSLPRPQDVVDLIFAKERGDIVDQDLFDQTMKRAVSDVIARQVNSGIDIVSDGEMSKISYATYIKDRYSGFDGDSPRRTPADLEAFPGFLTKIGQRGGTPTYRRPCCVAEIRLRDERPLRMDLMHLADAISEHQVHSSFMNAPSPGVVALFQPNQHYASDDLYLEALGEALRTEYEAIVAAGLALQIDSPDLGLGRHMMYKDLEESAYLRRIEQHVEILNHALRNVPADKARMHVCWGNYEGPHHKDIPLATILPTVLKAKPSGLLFETANPRHGHEWETIHEMRDSIPDTKILIPGVIDSTTNFIEHPRLIAQRLRQFTNIVGVERVIAGSDCGFGTFAGYGVVDPDIVFAKFEAMAEGAAIASAV
ncbi:MAG: epoxyalkane--coenzyme M transferase [Betaproteobacteria bacterium]|nr:epoxyalkane--coenzyme M transferase [Betaproteobacteria bacterium]NBO44967.1 epoxyalkane--coenzyme M transferase [Betaproteobacteria bacterium]NBP11223.1 epoxyalkane--coenzyme M transferase [Betaproteobacteria bacterium]NBP62347.1 epoxyalkane--coenzyme M transferase [Betaproteobacteria bacterium]NBQ09664.1 epoxyalkane--coenzyme M transferase [Betaproteobacteria bacterium]